ncbi:V-type proton ATPase subunit H-like [Babylonia areolata]|uniref:V-type proton ATPase subunit H-like n=1 Tax=Babylonia areolata TaxID=304850 RepID=UPI003FD5ED1D
MTTRSMKDIQDLEKEARVATSILQQRAKDVRSNEVNWQSYLQGQMISHDVFDFMKRFDHSSPEDRKDLINQNPTKFAEVFRQLIDRIAKDQTLQYILTLLDDALQEDRTRVEIFREFARKRKESVWQPFFQLLERGDMFIVYQSSRIIAKIACWSKEPMERKSLQSYLNWLKEQLKLSNNEYHITVARCLQMVLRVDSYRHAFADIDGMTAIATMLASYEKIGFQLTYQLIFCMWCLSFSPLLVPRMNSLNLIPLLTEIFAGTERDKVKRMVVALFRNMLEKPEETAVVQDYAMSMIRCKVIKHLEFWHSKKVMDSDVQEDVDWVAEKLETSVQDLSSWDEYVNEVRSGNLEWSPVHKCDRFWRENAINLNDKNYELLRILVRLLETSRDALVLSVAAHDIGEYIRYYPRGKNILEQLGAKQRIMHFLTHEDPNVRYESLLALQKLMVHNWEYLGKKMTEDQSRVGGLIMDVKS